MTIGMRHFHGKTGALTLLAFLMSGCLSSYNHYVKSAEATPSSIPLVPAILPAGEKEKVELSLHARYRGPTQMNFVTKPVYEAEPEPDSRGFRGDYKIRQAQQSLGVTLRDIHNDYFDWYLAMGASFDTRFRPTGLLGLGFTIPFPFLNVRLSPAFGLHTYTNRVVDSVVEYSELIGQRLVDTSTHVIDNRALRLGLVGSVSVSAWLPNPKGRPWRPYLQFQGNWIGMSAKDTTVTTPSEIMVLHGRVVAIGVEYTPTKSIVWNTRVAGEYLWNQQDGDWGYRAETGIGFRLDR